MGKYTANLLKQLQKARNRSRSFMTRKIGKTASRKTASRKTASRHSTRSRKAPNRYTGSTAKTKRRVIKLAPIPEDTPMVDFAARERAFDQAKMHYARLAEVLNTSAAAPGQPSIGELWQMFHRFKKQLKIAATGSPALAGVGPYFAQMDQIGAAVAQRAKDLGQADADIMAGLTGMMSSSRI